MVRSQTIAHILLRVGVAFAFLYAAIDSFLQPYSWIDYIPQAATMVAPAGVLLQLFAALEIVIALWLLSGWQTRYPAWLATVMLLAIVMLNMAEFQLLFRDVSIAAAALALALWPASRSVMNPS